MCMRPCAVYKCDFNALSVIAILVKEREKPACAFVAF